MSLDSISVVIATNSRDKLNYGEVARHLSRRGYAVTIYETDSIARGTREFSLFLDKHGSISFTYDNHSFDTANIGAAWYRYTMDYGEYADPLRGYSLREEYVTLQDNVWENIPKSAWLNSPDAIRRADIKIPQLAVAASLGFHVPETLISNTWEKVDSIKHDELIVKMAGSTNLQSKEGEKIMHTTKLKRSALPKQAISYPGMWQPFYKKKREWRITVVGEKIFSAAIYTKPHAKDDWRKHQFGPGVTFTAETFPHDLEQKCIALLRHFGLRYGAFDFIETPEGEFIFLEVNPNGQFMWLEERLGLPISEAIASELINIATRRNVTSSRL